MSFKEAAAKLTIFAIALFLGQQRTAAQPSGANLPKFLGRAVTVTKPGTDADGFYPTGPASICIEGPPQRQCYAAPEDYGRWPTVKLIQVEKDTPALLFSAASGGVSGFGIHFALLRPGTKEALENLFPLDLSVSSQSQNAFWQDTAVSSAQVFVTADFVWGPDESHFSEHRYIISAYIQRPSSRLDDLYYYLEDRYMTARKYDSDATADILNVEKQEIIGRLKRAKAARSN